MMRIRERLQASKTPLHANLWPGRGSTDRELSEEVNNLYRLVSEYEEKLLELEERVRGLEE